MAHLDNLAEANSDVKWLLEDMSVGHKEVAKRLNLSGVTDHNVDEKSVRRYRAVREMELDRLASPSASDANLALRGRRDSLIPTWTPGIDYDPNVGGEFRTTPITVELVGGRPEVEPEEAELLQQFDLSPEVWEVTSARKSMWQNAGGEWLMAQRVSFKKRDAGGLHVKPEDVENILTKYVVRKSPRTSSKQKPIETLLVPAGDFQLGKQEGGGTAATVERFGKITNDIAEYISDRGGVQNLVLGFLGDCIEGIVSQNGRMLTTLDITITEQVRVYRRLMMHQLGALAPLAERVLLATVPGNHDETTREQKMPHSDSWSIEGASAVEDWAKDRPGFDHITFVYPERDSHSITLDVNGQVLCFLHGHGTGKSNPNQIVDWWAKQSHGRQLPGQADLLITAHWHHLRVLSTGGNRTWIQIPALDGGSGWWRDKTGDDPESGILTLELDAGTPVGWHNLTVWT
jgi:predicted phosphodiesterase